MDIPVPSIETIKLVWNWSLQQLQLWFDVLRNPSEVLKTIDLDSTDSLIVALKFAIFPIWLTCLVTLPPYLLQKDVSLGLIGYFVVSTVAQAVLIFGYAVAQGFSATILRGKGSLKASTISTLYATAFLPLNQLLGLFEINQKDFLRFSEASITPIEYWYSLMLLALIIYLTFKFVPMTRVVHKVGRLRATMICWLTMAIGFLIQTQWVDPWQEKMFGMQ